MQSNFFTYLLRCIVFLLIFLSFRSFATTPDPALKKSIDSLRQALTEAEEGTSRIGLLHQLAVKYQALNDFKSAKACARDALSESRKANCSRCVAKSLSVQGEIFYVLKENAKAIENFFESLKIYEEMGDKRNVSLLYSNVGAIYRDQKNYPMALGYYRKSLSVAKNINDEFCTSVASNSLGAIYYSRGVYDSAMTYFEQALKIREKQNKQPDIANSLTNIGLVYAQRGEYTKSLDYYVRALRIAETIHWESGIANGLNNIGDIYYHMGNYDIAEKNYLKSLEHAKMLNEKERLLDNYTDMARNSVALKQFDRAYQYLKQEKELREFLFNTETSRQIAEMQAKYESDEREKENKLLLQKSQIQQMEIEKEKEAGRRVYIIFLSAIAFAVVISLLLFNRYKLEQRKKLDEQQKLNFKAVMEAEEKERRRISQELHDGLGQMLSTVKLNMSALEDQLNVSDRKTFSGVLTQIDEACDEVRTISHNMMSGVLIGLGLVSALGELARRINDSYKIKVEVNVNFTQPIRESAEMTMYRIIQEVVQNMLKHAQANFIIIALNKDKLDLFIQILDNGIGFDVSQVEKSAGLGWKNVHLRTAMLNGHVTVRSVPSKGTAVSLHFPNLFAE